jgi:hypothetical protein
VVAVEKVRRCYTGIYKALPLTEYMIFKTNNLKSLFLKRKFWEDDSSNSFSVPA